MNLINVLLVLCVVVIMYCYNPYVVDSMFKKEDAVVVAELKYSSVVHRIS